MKYTKLLSGFLLLSVTFFTVVSCKKVTSPVPLNGQGQTIVKFVFTDATANPNGEADTLNGINAGTALATLEILPTPQTIVVADIRRDVPNAAELDKPMTVIIHNDPGAVTEYDASLTPLPENLFVADPGNPLNGNDYTVTFQPGEFAKELKITVPDVKNTLDLANAYAMGFTISSADPDGHISTLQKKLVVTLIVKNEWDADYKSERGFFYHPTVPRAIPAGSPKHCITAGINSVFTELGDFNGVAQPTTYYVKLTIDDQNNVIIGPGTGAAPSTNPVVTLSALPTVSPGYTAFPGSTPSIYNNTYDPNSKTFYLRYGYLNPTGVWRAIEEVLVRD